MGLQERRHHRTQEEVNETVQKDGGLPRRVYVKARAKKSEMKKLAKWLTEDNRLELATSKHGAVYIFNRTLIRHALWLQCVDSKECLEASK